jgi:hypothetical protein
MNRVLASESCLALYTSMNTPPQHVLAINKLEFCGFKAPKSLTAARQGSLAQSLQCAAE